MINMKVYYVFNSLAEYSHPKSLGNYLHDYTTSWKAPYRQLICLQKHFIILFSLFTYVP
jgi:hypothetical protein